MNGLQRAERLQIMLTLPALDAGHAAPQEHRGVPFFWGIALKRVSRVAIIAMLTCPASAQDIPKTDQQQFQINPNPCFETISPAQGVEPYSLVLLDRCTGKSWILTRVFMDKNANTWTYRWSPISVGDSEAHLSRPSASPTYVQGAK